MRKYIVSTLGLLLVLMSCLTLYAADQRVIRVGAFNYFPGIFKDTDGAVKGFYVDALADIAQRENIRFVYLYGSWSEGLERIKTGEVDMLTSVAFTPERAEFLDYAKTPLMTVWGELYVPLSSDIDGILAVKGKKIAVMKNDFNARHFIELVKKFGITCEFVEVPGFDEVFKAVAAKEVDAGVVNNIFGVARHKEFRLRSTGVAFNPFDIFFAVAKGKNSELLVLLDNYLHNWRHQTNSPYNQARQKWLHGSDNLIHVIPPWLVTTAAVVAALALCAFAFIVILKKQVISRTRSVIESSKRYQIVSERQKAILAAVSDIIMEVDTNKVYTWANAAGLEFFGDDVVGREAFYYFAGEQNTYKAVQPLFDKSEDVIYVESLQRRKDGAVRLLAWWCKVLWDEQGVVTGGLSTARDITENKLVEHKLLVSEERFRLIMETVAVVPWEFNIPENSWTYVGPQVTELMGYAPEEWTTLEWWREIIHPEDQAWVPKYCAEMTSRGEEHTMEYRLRTKAGTFIWVHDLVTIEMLDGKPHIMRGIIVDITERKLAEAKLAESEGILRDIFESTLSGFWDWNLVDNTEYLSPTFKKMFGYEDHEMDNSPEAWQKIIFPEDLPGVLEVFGRHVKSHGREPFSNEIRYRHRDGSTVWVFCVGRVIEWTEDGAPVRMVGCHIDITDRKRAEEELLALERQFQQTQKLESLGVLAGGIAHDFNNILAIIVGYCGLTKMNYKSAEKNIPEIEKAAERAAALCRQMLAYAGKATFTESQVNVRTLVDEMVSMLQTTIPKNVVIKRELGIDIPFIMGDASQLRQVVMNLVINAAEAIGDGNGELDVKLAKEEIKPEQPLTDHLGFIMPAGRYICLEVSDNGCGMDDETMRKIFEPFYTTKFAGRGLGMSAVLGIIKEHNGSLQLESRLGHGTTFRVYLPVLQRSKVEIEEAQQITASAAWHGSGTILLAEDEEQVKSIAIILLQELGFTVIDAANGTEALELYKKNAQAITLVLTDAGMPVMDGYELFHTLKQLNPQLPIIITSGFGECNIASKIPFDEIAGVLNKPYNLEQLREILKMVVESVKPANA